MRCDGGDELRDPAQLGEDRLEAPEGHEGPDVLRVIEALLQAGPLSTPYVRAGDGPVVLLVQAEPCVEIARSASFRRLAARHRVIGVAPPPGAGTDWLRDLIDGLGLARPQLIGNPAHKPLLDAFVDTYPDRISGMTLLDETGGSARNPSG